MTALLNDSLLCSLSVHGQDKHVLAKLANEIYNSSPLPSSVSEEWKFTSLNFGGEKIPLSPLISAPKGVQLSQAEDFIRLVFVNGFFDDTLSTDISELASQGVVFDICNYDGDENSYRQFFEYFPLSALSAHSATAPLDITIRSGASARMQFLFIGETGSISHHGHCLRVKLEAKAKLELFEKHISASADAKYIHHDFLRFDLAESAKLTHHKLQVSENSATHLGHADVHLQSSAVYEYGFINLGSGLGRQDLHVHLRGQHSQAEVRSLLLPLSGQVQHLSTDLQHLTDSCTSRQQVKIIAGDNAKATYQGRVYIDETASGSVGNQHSRGLLLDNSSQINNKPELKIYTDDVECAHGSAVGELEEEPLFYLKSRGIDELQAYDLLLQSYVNEVAEFFSRSQFFLEVQVCLSHRLREYADYLRSLRC